MDYEGWSNTIVQDITVNNEIIFNTVITNINLETSDGKGLENGTIKYAGSKWIEIGNTDINGEITKELLPLSYKFKMTYEVPRWLNRDQIWQNIFLTSIFLISPIIIPALKASSQPVKFFDSIGWES